MHNLNYFLKNCGDMSLFSKFEVELHIGVAVDNYTVESKEQVQWIKNVCGSKAVTDITHGTRYPVKFIISTGF